MCAIKHVRASYVTPPDMERSPPHGHVRATLAQLSPSMGWDLYVSGAQRRYVKRHDRGVHLPAGITAELALASVVGPCISKRLWAQDRTQFLVHGVDRVSLTTASMRPCLVSTSP